MLLPDAKALSPLRPPHLPPLFRRTRSGPATGGLLAPTLVATETGWRPAGSLRPGIGIETWDGGLCPLAFVEELRPPPGPLVLVPGGSFGACSDLWLAPGQGLLLALPAVAAHLGTAGALLRAADLVGHQGARLVRPPGHLPAALIRLGFARSEFAYVNTGVLIEGAPPLASESYLPRLAPPEARQLLCHLAALAAHPARQAA